MLRLPIGASPTRSLLSPGLLATAPLPSGVGVVSRLYAESHVSQYGTCKPRCAHQLDSVHVLTLSVAVLRCKQAVFQSAISHCGFQVPVHPAGAAEQALNSSRCGWRAEPLPGKLGKVWKPFRSVPLTPPREYIGVHVTHSWYGKVLQELIVVRLLPHHLLRG